MNLKRISELLVGFDAMGDKLKAYVLTVFHARYNEITIETSPNPEVLEILEGRVDLLIEKHRDMLFPDLKFQLMEGYKNGESVDQISQRVKEVFSGTDYEIERVVRTEILNASNAGAFEANRDKGAKFKRWKAAMGNSRTSADSKRLNGQVQPIDEPFVDPENGDTCMYPPNRPNCRCSVEYFMEDPDADEPVQKKVVHVRASRGRKAHTRNVKPGTASREGTSKIESLPESIKTEILNMRVLGYSGEKIKANLESSIGSLSHPVQAKLVAQGIITDTTRTLRLTGAGITAWAKTKGVDSPKKREAAKIKVEHAESKAKIIQDALTETTARNESLAGDVDRLSSDLLVASTENDRIMHENQRHREDKRKLRNEVESLKAELKQLKSQNGGL